MREDRAGRVTMPEAREREDMGRIFAAMRCAPPSGSLAACIARRAPRSTRCPRTRGACASAASTGRTPWAPSPQASSGKCACVRPCTLLPTPLARAGRTPPCLLFFMHIEGTCPVQLSRPRAHAAPAGTARAPAYRVMPAATHDPATRGPAPAHAPMPAGAMSAAGWVLLSLSSRLDYFSLNSSCSCLRSRPVTYLYSDGHGLPRRIVSRPRRSSARTGHTPQADAVHSLVHARALSFSLSPALYSRCLPKGLGVLRERPPSVKSPVLTRSAHALAAEPHAEGGC